METTPYKKLSEDSLTDIQTICVETKHSPKLVDINEEAIIKQQIPELSSQITFLLLDAYIQKEVNIHYLKYL